MREYEERCSAALVRAIIKIESAWQPGVASSKGPHARGCTTLWRDAFVLPPRKRVWRSCVLVGAYSFMVTFAWLWPRMPQARSRFSRGDWTTHRKKFTHTFNGLCNIMAPSWGS
jgi:hypothetical protein